MDKVSAFWMVILAVIITWHVAKAHTRVQQRRGQGKAGKLLSFAGGRAAAAGDNAADRPIPQGEDLPTEI